MWEAARRWKLDHDVTVIARDIDETDLDGVTLRHVHLDRPGLTRFAQAARRHYSLDEFDHVISFGAQPVPASVLWVNSVHRAWLEASHRFPGTSRWRDPRLRYLMPSHRERLAIEAGYFREQGIKRIVTVADQVGHDLTRLYGVDPALMTTVHNGFDPAEFDPTRRAERRGEARTAWGLPDDAIVLGIVANELPRKGFDVLVEAVALVEDPRLHVLLAGTADPRRYAPTLDRLGLTHRMRYVGQQSDVGRVHAALDVFVLPTKYEAFCLAVVEALASGLPVITTAVPGAGDLIEHGVNGLLQDDPENAAELAGLLRQVTDAHVRGAMAAAARPSVDHLTWANLFDAAAIQLAAAR